jgi:Zn-dependent peptidase ImmA (M78 family)
MTHVLSDLAVPVASIDLSQPSIRGLALVHGDGTVMAVNESSSYSKRSWSRSALLAHELCHVLFDRNHGSELGIASGPWAPRHLEQRANAFAAMFLMPEDGVTEVVESSGADPLDWIRRVAHQFGASYRAAIQHLFHLGFFDFGVRDELLDGLPIVAEPALGDSCTVESADALDALVEAD